MVKTMAKLNQKQARFVQEYMVDLNATQAAIRAGYSERTAYSQGQRLLKHVEVQAQLQKAMKKRAERTEITQDMVVKELAKIGFANLGDFMRVTSGGEPYYDLSDMTPEKSAALSEVTVEDFTEGRGPDARDVRRIKLRLCDKRAALVDLGKHLGMFREGASDEDVPLPTTVKIEVVDGRKS